MSPVSSGLQEVLHLHALWHSQASQPLPQLLRPNPRPAAAAAFKNTQRKKTNRRPSDAPSYSEIRRPIAQPPSASKKRKETNHGSSGAPSTAEIQRPIARSNPPPSASKNKNKKQKQSDAPAAVEIEWPCPPAPITKTVGWGDLAPSLPPPPPPSAEDQARAAALLAQRPGLRACQEFFSSEKNGSDDEDEEEDLIDGDSGGSFLLGLFEKDGDLRSYYEKNCDKGEFCCLVCWGIGEKKGKRFPDCVGLVQHCNSISKTKRKGAHRGLAKAVCRVLAWDIKRLPSIVLDLGDPLGKSLEKAAESKEDATEGSKQEGKQ